MAKTQKTSAPDESFREWRRIARERGLREWFLWIPAFITMAGILTWNTQHPAIEYQPIFYEFSSARQNFVRIIEGGEDITKNQLVREKSLIGYLVDRERVDEATARLRYEEVFAQSSKPIWKTFKRDYLENKTSLAHTAGFTRDITIVRSPNFIDDDIIQIEYETRDTLNGQASPPQRWLATITFEFIQLKISYEKRYQNVTGLNVTKYGISKVSHVKDD